jgi:hypothetical protein
VTLNLEKPAEDAVDVEDEVEETEEDRLSLKEHTVEAAAAAVRGVEALAEGSAILATKVGPGMAAWCRRGHRDDLEGVSAQLGVWVRGAVIAGGGYGMWRVVEAHPGTLWAVAGGWCLACLRARVSARKAKAEAEEAKAEAAKGGSASAPAGARRPSPEEFVHLLHDLVQEHSGEGKATPGLHWPQVLAGLTSRYPGGGSKKGAWTGPDGKALCEAAGVPTTTGTRARGEGARGGVSTGLRVRDLPARPPLPSPTPSPGGAQAPVVAVVSAGQIPQQGQQQQQQQAADNSGHWSPEVGGWIVPDPDNPVRCHVVRPTAGAS